MLKVVALSVSIFYYYAVCHYAECRYAEWRDAIPRSNILPGCLLLTLAYGPMPSNL
jgi:hypothetical protein